MRATLARQYLVPSTRKSSKKVTSRSSSLFSLGLDGITHMGIKIPGKTVGYICQRSLSTIQEYPVWRSKTFIVWEIVSSSKLQKRKRKKNWAWLRALNCWSMFVCTTLGYYSFLYNVRSCFGLWWRSKFSLKHFRDTAGVQNQSQEAMYLSLRLT